MINQLNFFKKEALLGSFFSITDQSIVSLSNFLAGIIVARALAPEGFGVYSLYLSTLMILAGFQNSLITGPLRVLGVKKNKNESISFFQAQIQLQFLFSGIISLFIMLILYKFQLGNNFLRYNFGICIFFWQIMELLRVIYLTRFNIIKLLLTDLIIHVLRITFLCILAYKSYLNLGNVFLVLSISCSIGVLAFFFTEKGLFLNKKISLKSVLKINWNYGRWLLLETLAYNASTQIYLYFTALWVDSSSVGALSAVQNILNIFNVLLIGLTSFATPLARKKLITIGFSAWKNYLCQTGFFLTSGAIFIGIIASVFREPLLTFLYSTSFSPYSYLLPICSLNLCLKSINTIFSVAFRTANFPEIGFYSKFVTAIITLTISYPMLNNFGVTGAALGLLLTQFMWMCVYIIYIYKGTLQKALVIERLDVFCNLK